MTEDGMLVDGRTMYVGKVRHKKSQKLAEEVIRKHWHKEMTDDSYNIDWKGVFENSDLHVREKQRGPHGR
jgi:hypothetical protein